MKSWKKRATQFLLMLSCNLLGAAVAPPHSRTPQVSMAGFLLSRATQPITPPIGDEWSFKISFILPEGTRVTKGTLVARIEGERSDEQKKQWEINYQSGRTTRISNIEIAERDIAQLAETLAQQRRELSVLLVSQPKDKLAADFALFMSSKEKLFAELDIEVRKFQIETLVAKAAAKEHILSLMRKNYLAFEAHAALRRGRFDASKAASELHAKMDGIIVHHRLSWSEELPRAGVQVYSGAEVLSVVDERRLYVIGFLREEQWHFLKENEAVSVRILGQRPITVSGRVIRISPMVMKASDWYQNLPVTSPLVLLRSFRVEVALDQIPEESRPGGEVVIEKTGEKT